MEIRIFLFKPVVIAVFGGFVPYCSWFWVWGWCLSAVYVLATT